MALLSTRLRASLCSFALLAFSFSWNSAARRKATSLCRLLSAPFLGPSRVALSAVP
ncbi:hypothetical protein PF006_g24841 [Phytophthora fragariae]|uniref:RxLR effector protein n=1 Tax=Phytophthora fragariae TaxID=53985 RepID=A0A6A3RA76_9STRA|nr:hypothetical protein PF006_g24841 [Phytophthora fragariae]